MERLKTEPGVEQNETFGVLDYHIDNDHYVVNVKWKDGIKTVQHFPVVGFTVVNPATKKYIGNIEGKKALEILQQHAGDFNHQEFSWRDFI